MSSQSPASAAGDTECDSKVENCPEDGLRNSLLS